MSTVTLKAPTLPDFGSFFREYKAFQFKDDKKLTEMEFHGSGTRLAKRLHSTIVDYSAPEDPPLFKLATVIEGLRSSLKSQPEFYNGTTVSNGVIGNNPKDIERLGLITQGKIAAAFVLKRMERLWHILEAFCNANNDSVREGKIRESYLRDAFVFAQGPGSTRDLSIAKAGKLQNIAWEAVQQRTQPLMGHIKDFCSQIKTWLEPIRMAFIKSLDQNQIFAPSLIVFENDEFKSIEPTQSLSHEAVRDELLRQVDHSWKEDVLVNELN